MTLQSTPRWLRQYRPVTFETENSVAGLLVWSYPYMRAYQKNLAIVVYRRKLSTSSHDPLVTPFFLLFFLFQTEPTCWVKEIVGELNIWDPENILQTIVEHKRALWQLSPLHQQTTGPRLRGMQGLIQIVSL